MCGGLKSVGKAQCGYTYLRRRVVFVLCCVVVHVAYGGQVVEAAPAQPLPLIVTYETERWHDAERVARRNPKEFWVRQILARLEDKKPTGILGLKQPTTTLIDFTLGRDGKLVSRTISRSSGVPVADKEAIALLERAQPFPPMPDTMGEASLSFSLPMRFR